MVIWSGKILLDTRFCKFCICALWNHVLKLHISSLLIEIVSSRVYNNECIIIITYLRMCLCLCLFMGWLKFKTQKWKPYMCEFIIVLTYNFQKIKRSFEVVLEVGSFLTCSVRVLFSVYGLKHQLIFTTSQKSCNSIGFLMEIFRVQILHFYYCN